MADNIQPNQVTINPDGSTSITYDNATFKNATIETATITNETVTGSEITNANISNETVTGSAITDATITDATVTGLQIPTGTGGYSPPGANQLQFFNPSTLAVDGAVFGWEFGGETGVAASAGAITKVILASNGGSDFLQLASAGKNVAFGISSVSWPGGTQQSGTTSIAHGLGTGAGPKCVLALPVVSPSGFFNPSLCCTSSDSVHASFQANVSSPSPAGGTSMSFFWLAIG